MSYIGQEPGLGKAEHFIFTASGSETSVSTADDGLPISYTVNQVSVYLNGVKLIVGTGKDCQATNGSTITGLSALAASDVVEVVALSTFSPADSIPSTGGSYTGQVTLPSPVLTGVPVTPTASAATNTTQIASTAYVRTEVTNLIDSAPGALDTLNELAAALNDDAAFSTTVTNSIALKAPIASPTFTGTVALAAGVDLETSTTGKVKQKGAVMQSSTHQAIIFGY